MRFLTTFQVKCLKIEQISPIKTSEVKKSEIEMIAKNQGNIG